uniref:Uncharacterized protein n=1 Tax=Aplanochytrium stocchinoi TaxID=215587 RepID=A0A7S3LJR6_9STRA
MKKRLSKEILLDMKQLKSSAPRIDQNLLPISVPEESGSESESLLPLTNDGNKSKNKNSKISRAKGFNFEKLYSKPRKESCFEKMLPAGVKTYQLDVSTVQILSGQKCGCEGCLAHYPTKGGWLIALADVLDHHMKFGGRIGTHCKLVRDYLYKKSKKSDWCEDAIRTAKQVSEVLDKAIKSPRHKHSNGNFLKLVAIGIVRFEIGRRLTRIFPSFGLPETSQENIVLCNKILKKKFAKDGVNIRGSKFVDPFLLEFAKGIEDGKIDELFLTEFQDKKIAI